MATEFFLLPPPDPFPQMKKGKKKLRISNVNNVMKSRQGYKNPLRVGVVLAMGSAPTPSLSVARSLFNPLKGNL